MLGCGTSDVPRLLAPHCAHVTACDISPTAIRESRAACDAGNVTFVEADLRALAYGVGDFDLLIDKGTLAALQERSVQDASAGYRCVWEILGPEGLLITFSVGYPEPELLMSIANRGCNFETTACYDIGGDAMAFAARRQRMQPAGMDISEPWYRGKCVLVGREQESWSKGNR